MIGSSILTVTGCSKSTSDKAKQKHLVEVNEGQEWFDSTRTILGEEYADLGPESYYFDDMNSIFTDSAIYVYVTGNYPIDYQNMDSST